MAKKNTVATIANVLLIIGGLNWGLIALGIDLLGMGTVAKVIYGLVGLSALYAIFMKKK